MSGAEVTVSGLTFPLPPTALGWFCLGYHMSDAPGRAATIFSLLQQAGFRPESEGTAQAILNRLLRSAPQTVTFAVRPLAAVAPVVSPGSFQRS